MGRVLELWRQNLVRLCDVAVCPSLTLVVPFVPEVEVETRYHVIEEPSCLVETKEWDLVSHAYGNLVGPMV